MGYPDSRVRKLLTRTSFHHPGVNDRLPFFFNGAVSNSTQLLYVRTAQKTHHDSPTHNCGLRAGQPRRNNGFGRINQFITNPHSSPVLVQPNDMEHSQSSFRSTKNVGVRSVIPLHQQSSWGMAYRGQSRVAEKFLLRRFFPTFSFDRNYNHI